MNKCLHALVNSCVPWQAYILKKCLICVLDYYENCLICKFIITAVLNEEIQIFVQFHLTTLTSVRCQKFKY